MVGYTLLIEGALALLLVAFLYYAVMLNRRLGSLRDSKGELEKLIITFADATGRADRSISGFKSTAEQSGRALQETIDRAHVLRDDLAFLVEKADAVADRLEAAIKAARGSGIVVPGAARDTEQTASGPVRGEAPNAGPVAEAGAQVQAPRVQSKAERELMKALQTRR